MEYKSTVYRPPVEADSLLVPVTEGCTHNACTFCNMYQSVRFCPVPLEEIDDYVKTEVKARRTAGQALDRCYLVGADPFALPAHRLLDIIEVIRTHAPEVGTITMYTAVRNIMAKSDDDLELLASKGVDELYVGIESALDDVLAHLNKGTNVAQAYEQTARLAHAGITYRAMIMFGCAGTGRAHESADAMVRFINETKPDMMLPTTIGAFEGTRLAQEVAEGTFTLATETEIIEEEKQLIACIDVPGLRFWGAHPLNTMAIDGILPDDRAEMIDDLNYAMEIVASRYPNTHLNRSRL